MFVCEDESVYAVGNPNVFKGRWDEAYSQKKDWKKLEKPADCVDFAKVSASGSQRLILTKSGQLFCQGENMRCYVDPDVNADQMAPNFIECTDVFPLEGE